MVTRYTCTINKFSQILKDDRHVSKIWLPSFIRKKLTYKLILFWNDMQGGKDDFMQKIYDEAYRYSLYIRILMLQNLHKSISISINENNTALYKELFKKTIDKESLKIIATKINRLKIQYEVKNDTPPSNNFDFDKYIASLELLLEIDLSDKYLYQLKAYQDKALEKIKEYGRD